ncbi:zinc finger protein ZAT1-like [Salvia divinorum]|uniref:Zinc finger protein ZAT1-like n=1 Tax=Salvia divinorum TaxID=28513 RepID=A0ABD1HTE9_SALDI
MGEEEGESGRNPALKTKYQKKAAAEEEGVPSHYCRECNRSFSSGKALGGHMSSAHVQANKDYSMRKAASSSSKSKSSPGSPSAVCRLCDRAFQSQKSLFGHMRCHPDRDWRGMEPPPPPPPRDAKAVVDSGELGFFKDWPTCKRGRPSLSSSKAAYGDEGKGKGKAPESSGVMDEMDEMFKVAVQVLASGKRERGQWKHRCKDCGRVFENHEALGGHRANHNKFKMSIVNTSTRHLVPKMAKMKINMKMAKKFKADYLMTDGDPGPSARANANADSASASASTITPTSASASASASTITPTSASAFVFDIDLNMFPPEEEVDGMEESSGHTSSNS